MAVAGAVNRKKTSLAPPAPEARPHWVAGAMTTELSAPQLLPGFAPTVAVKGAAHESPEGTPQAPVPHAPPAVKVPEQLVCRVRVQQVPTQQAPAAGQGLGVHTVFSPRKVPEAHVVEVVVEHAPVVLLQHAPVMTAVTTRVKLLPDGAEPKLDTRMWKVPAGKVSALISDAVVAPGGVTPSQESSSQPPVIWVKVVQSVVNTVRTVSCGDPQVLMENVPPAVVRVYHTPFADDP